MEIPRRIISLGDEEGKEEEETMKITGHNTVRRRGGSRCEEDRHQEGVP